MQQIILCGAISSSTSQQERNSAVNKLSTTVVIPMVQQRSEGEKTDAATQKKLPKEVDKQLEIMYKNGEIELENISLWLRVLGGGKARNEFIKVIKTPKFRQDMITLFEQARNSQKKPDADVCELMKDKETFEKMYSTLKDESKEFSLLHTLLGTRIVKSKFYKSIQQDGHKDLLYRNR